MSRFSTFVLNHAQKARLARVVVALVMAIAFRQTMADPLFP